MEEKLLVSKIENGTVIDHIPAGRGLVVLKILGMDPASKIVVASNVDSQKHGRKDIIKIEGRYLTPRELDIISLIAPEATINKIVKSEVREKFMVELPKTISGVLRCANVSCITNVEKEPVPTKFVNTGGMLQCWYCDSFMRLDEIIDYLKI